MPTTIYSKDLDEYKTCCGNGCSNKVTAILLIKYLNKQGHFCQECATDLIESGLAEKIDDYVENQIHHPIDTKGV